MDVGCRWSVGLSEVFPGVRVGVEVPEQRFSSESWLWIRAAPHPAAPAVINVCLCTELGGLRVTAGDTPRMEVVGGCGGAVPCCDLPSVVPNCAFSCARFITCPSTREGSRAVFPTQRATQPVQLLSISCFISACGLFNLLIVGKNNKRSSADLPSFPCL